MCVCVLLKQILQTIVFNFSLFFDSGRIEDKVKMSIYGETDRKIDEMSDEDVIIVKQLLFLDKMYRYVKVYENDEDLIGKL